MGKEDETATTLGGRITREMKEAMSAGNPDALFRAVEKASEQLTGQKYCRGEEADAVKRSLMGVVDDYLDIRRRRITVHRQIHLADGGISRIVVRRGAGDNEVEVGITDHSSPEAKRKWRDG